MIRSTSRNNILTLQHNDCCGCKACGDICPAKAITFATDEEGFLYPLVHETCMGCGLCVKICPTLNYSCRVSGDEQSYKACFDKNLSRRDTGSSGGIFGLLASKLMGVGWIVCGAAFDENLQLKHRFASNEKEVGPLKKSKYLQSDTSGVYSGIKNKLDSGEKVMFVGTPCQCNALKNFLRKDYMEHLLLVDFACHGVPSQDLFDKCIAYYGEKNHCEVIGYQFRHKPKRYGAPQNYKMIVKKGVSSQEVEGKYYEEPFYYGFQKYMTLRPSCYHCHWASTDRISDISLADFWGIEKVTNQWDRRDHPSLVILNTDFGRRCFQSITEELACIETTREESIRGNGSLIAPTNCPAEREVFFQDLQTKSFDFVVKSHLTAKRRILKDIYYAIPFGIRKMVLNKLRKL